MLLEVRKEVFWIKKVHKAHVNEVFHLPDPLPVEADAMFGANARAITCHEQ